MMTETNLAERIQCKMFIGTLIRPELRMHLEYSPSWKQAQTLAQNDEELTSLELQGRQYIGLLIPTDKMSLPEVKSCHSRITDRLKAHCPEFDTENTEWYVIPQMFVS